MSNWSILDLETWDNRIKSCAESFNLDWFPIIYEICDYYDMIGYMSYHGMPSHYSHWSYGKTFERTRQLYNLGMEGLPYELIINSNPSIAYLMRENPIYLQILIMAHCIGHSDFFKNNRMFSKTRPEHTVMKFKSARDRIKNYIEDPSIGIENVEKMLDAAHTIRFQTERNGLKRIPHDEIVQIEIDKINNKDKDLKFIDIDKIPVRNDHDLLGFMVEHGDHFKDWERDILEIVRDESQYFIPQIKTKVINEGWASFWHYKILNELKLNSETHIPFIKTHNQVIRPHIGAVNPYHLGFHIFNKIEKNMGLDECFFVREVHDDEQTIRRFLEREDCEELNLFSYSSKKSSVTIDEVSDEDGWKVVKDDLIRNTGMGSMPQISVAEISKYGELILEHDHDGRDLELDYADKVLNQIKYLWPKGAKIFTVIEDELWEMD